MTVKLTIFVLATVLLLVITIVAIREKRTWAWYRFLAFELNLGLIMLSAGYWFLDPFSPLQIVSWFFLVLSAYLALAGFFYLQNRGAPEKHFENTTKIVNTGIFRLIRHPMFASLIFLTIGVLLKRPTPEVIALSFLSIAASVVTARKEEIETAAKFGPAYEEYMKNSKKFIPFIY